jgi:plasmid replication protein
MSSKKSSRTIEKSIYFTFLLYPESLPSDWETLLKTTGRPIAVSPLHDKDVTSKQTLENQKRRFQLELDDNRYVWSEDLKDSYQKKIDDLQSAIDGKKKFYLKPHYHVIYIAKNPVTANSVRQKIQKLLGVDALAEVKIIATSVRNMYDYLTHESVDAIAKKKHVYDKKDILCLNNFDIDRYDELDSADKKELFYNVLDLVLDYGFRNIIELERFIFENGSEIGITINNFRNVIDGKSSMLRLYFDGAYQISKRKEGELEKLAADWMDVARRQSEELTTLKAKLKKFEEK